MEPICQSFNDETECSVKGGDHWCELVEGHDDAQSHECDCGATW